MDIRDEEDSITILTRKNAENKPIHWQHLDRFFCWSPFLL